MLPQEEEFVFDAGGYCGYRVGPASRSDEANNYKRSSLISQSVNVFFVATGQSQPRLRKRLLNLYLLVLAFEVEFLIRRRSPLRNRQASSLRKLAGTHPLQAMQYRREHVFSNTIYVRFLTHTIVLCALLLPCGAWVNAQIACWQVRLVAHKVQSAGCSPSLRNDLQRKNDL